MVKLQKPIPKKFGNKPKLDNPIKNKKQLNKGKSTGAVKNIQAKLLESPVKEAKTTKKPIKEVLQKNLHKKNPKGAQKEAVEDNPKPVDPIATQKDKNKGKKNKGKDTVVQNGDKRIEKPVLVKSTVPEKVAVADKAVVPVKSFPPGKVSLKVSPQKKGKVVVSTVAPTPKGPAPVKSAPPGNVADPVKVSPQKKGKVVVATVAPTPKETAPVKSAPTVKVAAPAKVAKPKKGKVVVSTITRTPKGPAPPVKVAAPLKVAKPKKGKVIVSTITPAPKGPALPVKVAAPVKVAPQKKDKVVVSTITPAPKGPPASPVKAAVPVKVAPQKKDKVVPTVTPPSKGPGKLQNKNKGNNKKAVETVVDPIPPTEELKVEKKTKLQNRKKAKIALKKLKRVSKGKPSTNDYKSEKKAKRAVNSIRFDPIPFDEDKFNAIVAVENIKQIAEKLKTQVEKEVANKKSSIFDDYRFFLQVGAFKIANCPKRMVKLTLKHALVDKDDDVLLVVPDLQRGAKADYEPTIHHYEDLLRSYGVKGITIMPMNQLRKEFSTFEQKRRLCATYDHFLCDGRIVSHVVGIVGKMTHKPSHTFHAVRLHEEKDVKGEIEKSLRKTAYRQLAKSSLHAIPLATHKFTPQKIAENVVHVVGQLKKVFPGGLGNVRNLYLKIDIIGTSSLPLYLSMAQAPEQTPMVVGPREQRMIKLKREANEVLSKFAMTKEGKLIKLTRTEVEKKRKIQEMKAALKEDEELPTKKAKKDKKASEVPKEKKKEEGVKELELPENEEDDDNSSDEDDDDAAQLEGSSDDDEAGNDEMGQLDQDEDDESTEEECETGIVENGLGDEESDEEEVDQQQATDGSGDDDDDDDNDEEEAAESD